MNLFGFLQSWWRSNSDRTRRMFVLLGIVAVAGYLYWEYPKRDNLDTSTPAVQQTIPSGYSAAPSILANPTGQAPVSPPAAPQFPAPEDLAVARSRWTDVKARIEEVRGDLDDAARDADSWSRLTQDLLASEAGRRIAGSQPCLDQYRALIEGDRPDSSRLDALRDSLNVHLKVAQDYLGQPQNLSQPSPAITEELNRIATDLETIAYRYRTDHRALESLVAETADMSPAEHTLQVALEARRNELSRQYREQLAAALAEAEAEGQRKIEEARAKAIKDKKEAEAEQITKLGEAEAEEIRQETANRLAGVQQKKKQLEADRLRALAEDPEVQKLYSPFLTEGTFQFTGPPTGASSRSQRPMPVSFGDLNSQGWLASVETFGLAMSTKPYKMLYRDSNDRTARAYPTTSREWDETERLLEQFKLLAPIWIEMKLLRP